MLDTIRIVRNHKYGKNNVHIGVYPLFVSRLQLIMGASSCQGDFVDYGNSNSGRVLSESQQNLAKQLFEEVPGINALFLGNGCVTIQHTGVFNDDEVVELATSVLTPYLEAELKFRSLLA